MDALRFDAFTRSLTIGSSRRGVLRRLAATALGGGVARLPHGASTKKRKKRTKKIKRNDFGCVNVGQQCRGKDANCCSGICQGKKPKHGKKDKSRCIAHDASNCQVGHLPCHLPSDAVDCTTTSDAAGLCYTTTGNGGYCAAAYGICVTCSTDQECQPLCGAGAACVLCKECESLTVQTACVGISGCPPP